MVETINERKVRKVGLREIRRALLCSINFRVNKNERNVN